jgi:hypothetical protein
MAARRPLHLWAHMPARTVEHAEELCTLSYVNGPGKLGARAHQRGHRHGGQEQPPRPARARLPEGFEIAPLVTMGPTRL